MVDRVIVITGGAAGLGRALARKFAKLGDKVVLLARSTAKLEKLAAEIGSAATPITCDVSSPESVQAAFDRIAREHGKVDVLINNAAVFEFFLMKKVDPAKIINAVTTNLAGPILCIRAALPLMKSGAHILNVTSESIEMLYPYLSVYVATKAGLERYSQTLRAELAEDGIRVTVVRCGQMVDEDMMSSSQEDMIPFMEACAKAGLDTVARGFSHYNSIAASIAKAIELPEDVQMPFLFLQSRHGVNGMLV